MDILSRSNEALNGLKTVSMEGQTIAHAQSVATQRALGEESQPVAPSVSPSTPVHPLSTFRHSRIPSLDLIEVSQMLDAKRLHPRNSICMSLLLSCIGTIILPLSVIAFMAVASSYLKRGSVRLQTKFFASAEDVPILPADTFVFHALSIVAPAASIIMMASPILQLIKSYQEKSMAQLPVSLFIAFLTGASMGVVYGARIAMPAALVTSAVGVALQLASLYVSFLIWRYRQARMIVVSKTEKSGGSIISPGSQMVLEMTLAPPPAEADVENGTSVGESVALAAAPKVMPHRRGSPIVRIRSVIQSALVLGLGKNENSLPCCISRITSHLVFVACLALYVGFIMAVSAVLPLETVASPVYGLACLLPYFITLPGFPALVKSSRKANRTEQMGFAIRSSDGANRDRMHSEEEISSVISRSTLRAKGRGMNPSESAVSIVGNMKALKGVPQTKLKGVSKGASVNFTVLGAMIVNNVLWFIFGMFVFDPAILGSASVALSVCVLQSAVYRVLPHILLVRRLGKSSLPFLWVRRIETFDQLYFTEYSPRALESVPEGTVCIIDLAIPFLMLAQLQAKPASGASSRSP